MMLITGSTGFVGRHLVKRLVAEGEKPRCLARSQQKATQTLPTDKIEVAIGDTTRPDTLEPAMRGIETVVHSAFITADIKEGRGVSYQAVNVEGTKNIVEAARQAGVKKIVLVSGLGTKPDKPGSYMQGRYLAEQYVKNSGLAWSVIQPSVQFGEHAAFFKGLADLIRTAPIVPVIGTSQRRFQPIWVEDVARCLTTQIREESRNGKTYVVGGPEQFTYGEVLDMLAQALGKKRLKAPLPMPLAYIGAATMQTVLPKPPITAAALTLFTFEQTTDLNAVERDFGFQPLSWRAYLAEHGVN
ncbi:MAG TPA: NAD(P)H-binding protein [Ktedonobacterales bacterium]|nr:NAD(P)H-binding protein [Ktedonobacterales bacterium]